MNKPGIDIGKVVPFILPVGIIAGGYFVLRSLGLIGGNSPYKKVAEEEAQKGVDTLRKVLKKTDEIERSTAGTEWKAGYYKQIEKDKKYKGKNNTYASFSARTNWVSAIRPLLINDGDNTNVTALFDKVRSKYELSLMSERYLNLFSRDLYSDFRKWGGKQSSFLLWTTGEFPNRDTMEQIIIKMDALPVLYEK